MRRISILSGLALALFLSLVAMELVESGWDFTIKELMFDLFDFAILAGAVVATAYVSLETREMRRDQAVLLSDLVFARAEGDRWQATAHVHIDGLHRAIQQQFDTWRLTGSEAAIALLILKGLAHKEIARLRNSSEATVRQQARAIYSKSGLESRAQLAAFFVEDLFAFDTERADSTRAPKGAIDMEPDSHLS